MREFSYVITDAQGIHARPAGQLVKLAAAYPCKVTIAKDGRSVDAKRIMGVMSLGAKQGTGSGSCRQTVNRKMRQSQHSLHS